MNPVIIKPKVLCQVNVTPALQGVLISSQEYTRKTVLGEFKRIATDIDNQGTISFGGKTVNIKVNNTFNAETNENV